MTPANAPIKILSNLKEFGAAIPADSGITHDYLEDDEAQGWRKRLIERCRGADIVILDGDFERLMAICAHRWMHPASRFKLISVDPILRRPRSFLSSVSAAGKRLMFKKVNRFVFYFKDVSGYNRYFGIGPDRARFVQFKINDWEKIRDRPVGSPDGEYVMCAGRTMRDVDGYLAAMEIVGVQGILHQQPADVMAIHGTARQTELPGNVNLVVDDSFSHEVFMNYIAKARLVVIPRFRGDIGPAGQATYMVAMALNKCVICGDGPGVSDVLTDQVVIVPPQDVPALAEAIKRYWHDDGARAEVAARGREFAIKQEGVERLHRDILRIALESAGESGRV